MATPNDPDARQLARRTAKFMGKSFKELGTGVGKRHNAACGPADYARVTKAEDRELVHRVRHEIDVAGGGGSREGMRVRRKAEAHPEPRSH